MEKTDFSKIIEILKSGTSEELQELVEKVHPADILEAVEDREDAHELLEKLPVDIVADVIDEAEEEDKYELLEDFPKTQQKRILNQMSSDEIADLVNQLEGPDKEEILSQLNKENRKDVDHLLRYDDECAGGIMTRDFLALYEHKTVLETLNYLRKEVDSESPYYLYAIDRQNHLKGVVSLRDIVVSDFDKEIADILNPNVMSVHVSEDQEEVAHTFEKYNFLLMPVVDDENHLLGIITVDDIIDVIIDESTEDIHKMAGINKEEKVDGSLWASVKSRLPWLVVNLLTAIFASSVIDLFSDTIAKIVALSAVMTIISGMGGNAGTQSLTIVVRALSLGEIDRDNAKRILFKEIGVGLFTGLVIGIFVALVAMYYEFNPIFGIIAGVAMVMNMICATFAGYSIPIILKKLHVDPALASAVFVTTVTDTLGFFFFLGLATLFIPYL